MLSCDGTSEIRGGRPGGGQKERKAGRVARKGRKGRGRPH